MALPGPAATTVPRYTTTGWRFGAASAWLWALGSAAWFVASAYLALPLVAAFPAQFLLQPLIWGAAVLAGTLVLARGAFGRWLPVAWSALALALVGLTLAGALDESLHGWALGRLGVFDWALLGPSAGLFALLVGSSVAGFGVLIAPRRASLPPLVFAVGGALLSGLVVAMNMPGLGDGLGAASVLPALLVAAAGAYALLTAFIAVLVAVRRELSDESGESDD
jgi:hypothetical protein